MGRIGAKGRKRGSSDSEVGYISENKINNIMRGDYPESPSVGQTAKDGEFDKHRKIAARTEGRTDGSAKSKLSAYRG